jgi:hypothetical protein
MCGAAILEDVVFVLRGLLEFLCREKKSPGYRESLVTTCLF